jgi:hypothetical protein
MKSDMNEPTDLASQLDQIFERPSGRALDEMRPSTFQLGIAPHANGSVLCSFGNTRVICSAMIEDQGAWLDASAKDSGRLAYRRVQHAPLRHPLPQGPADIPGQTGWKKH